MDNPTLHLSPASALRSGRSNSFPEHVMQELQPLGTDWMEPWPFTKDELFAVSPTWKNDEKRQQLPFGNPTPLLTVYLGKIEIFCCFVWLPIGIPIWEHNSKRLIGAAQQPEGCQDSKLFQRCNLPVAAHVVLPYSLAEATGPRHWHQKDGTVVTGQSGNWTYIGLHRVSETLKNPKQFQCIQWEKHFWCLISEVLCHGDAR